MNNFTSTIIKNPCPTCKVDAGVKCLLGTDSKKRMVLGQVCLERYRLYDSTMIDSHTKQARSFRTKRVYPNNTTSNCKANPDAVSHLRCNGTKKVGHGVTVRCPCRCHKIISKSA